MPKFKNKKAPEPNMRRGMLIFGLLLFLVLVTPMMKAAGPTYIISNSAKWTDVFSVILYSNLIGLPNSFLTSTAAGNYFLTEVNKGNFVRVISSSSQPYVLNYPSMIRSAGFEGADEITGNNLNLNLVSYLSNTTDFIVVGDSFGYNAIAVTPYAIQKKAWVFLADQNNIYQIDSVLSKRNIKSLLVYGYVDPAVTTVLSKYHPTTINTGDRFNDNIAIVKKYMETARAPQVVLTNGEILEQEIMSGSEPVLFTGQQNVPIQISNWLKNSTVKVGVLIGNDLVDAATNIRSSTGISVMVKFARSARSQNGGGGSSC